MRREMVRIVSMLSLAFVLVGSAVAQQSSEEALVRKTVDTYLHGLKFNDVEQKYDEKSCELNFEGSDVKTCKKEVSASKKNADQNEKAGRDLAEAGCHNWEVVCANLCDQP